MERIKEKNCIRAGIVAIGLGVGSLLLASCGQTSPPSPEQVSDDVEYFELENVKAANGEPVRCVQYGSGTTGLSDSKSWFGFSCDFQGTAQFPDEIQADSVTTTTQG
jgi:hypothetical protein